MRMSFPIPSSSPFPSLALPSLSFSFSAFPSLIPLVFLSPFDSLLLRIFSSGSLAVVIPLPPRIMLARTLQDASLSLGSGVSELAKTLSLRSCISKLGLSYSEALPFLDQTGSALPLARSLTSPVLFASFNSLKSTRGSKVSYKDAG
jgi:hypothetical protein